MLNILQGSVIREKFIDPLDFSLQSNLKTIWKGVLEMNKGLLIAGIIIFLVGIFGGIGLTVYGFRSTIGSDPASDYHHKLTSSGETIQLSKGEYDIWYDGLSLYDVELRDEYGSSITIDVPSMSESINSRTKYGSFEITSPGQYVLTYGGGSTVYITDPISVGGGLGLVFGGICGGIFVTVLGVVLTIIGAVTLSRSRKEQEEEIPKGRRHHRDVGRRGPPRYERGPRERDYRRAPPDRDHMRSRSRERDDRRSHSVPENMRPGDRRGRDVRRESRRRY